MIDLLFILLLSFIGWQLYLIANHLGQRVQPMARNEEAVEDGQNEPEPKRGR